LHAVILALHCRSLSTQPAPAFGVRPSGSSTSETEVALPKAGTSALSRTSHMYAVIRTGGKQYRVSEGETLRVEKLPGDVGASITFGEVLMLGGDKVTVGKPLISGASVTGTIIAQDRAKKIIVFKMRRRKNYRRKNGHRQWYTEVKITGIGA
jgi:large subunit ribosomal protein L21